jgi:hypothetical protein
MRAYVGQTRSPTLLRDLARLGIGECTVRGELPARRTPFFHDNGAFRDWEAVGRPVGDAAVERVSLTFGFARWLRDMRWMSYRGIVPDFVVVPDIVTGGIGSLAFSGQWRENVPVEMPAYLAVQNGMTEAAVADHLDEMAEGGFPYAGLFVGGDLPWKLATSAAWVAFAHGRGLRCHVGRVGVPDRVRWARAIGADSIDSSLPLMHHTHLAAFLGAVAEAS